MTGGPSKTGRDEEVASGLDAAGESTAEWLGVSASWVTLTAAETYRASSLADRDATARLLIRLERQRRNMRAELARLRSVELRVAMCVNRERLATIRAEPRRAPLGLDTAAAGTRGAAADSAREDRSSTRLVTDFSRVGGQRTAVVDRAGDLVHAGQALRDEVLRTREKVGNGRSSARDGSAARSEDRVTTCDDLPSSGSARPSRSDLSGNAADAAFDRAG